MSGTVETVMLVIRRFAVALTAATLVGCAGSADPAAAPSSPSATPIVTAPAPASTVRGDAGVALEAGAAILDASSQNEQMDITAEAGAEAEVPAARWIAERLPDEASSPAAQEVDGMCRPVRVGPDGLDALLCEAQQPIAKLSFVGGETVFPLVVVAVDPVKKKLRTVLRVPVRAGSLAEPLTYVHLAGTLAPDGSSVTIAETSAPDGNCAAATTTWREKWSDPGERSIQHDFLQTITSVCRARGTYVWRAGAFVPEPSRAR